MIVSAPTLTTDRWETMAEIKRRTGLRGEVVAAEVPREHRERLNVVRVTECEGVGIVEFKRRNIQG